ncbi:MAG: hypothetical protein Q8O76_06325 [Chloroflexota bacterium]|nr:hypothetical protein [Chloroflexota bacterium]
MIYELTTYDYCVASNDGMPEYVFLPPDWVDKKDPGVAEIGDPVGCPECHAWGAENFVLVKSTSSRTGGRGRLPEKERRSRQPGSGKRKK